MDPEQKQFLSLPLVPGRLNVQQVSWRLGFKDHDIPILVSAGLLKPLGNPPQNAPKYFATTVIDELRSDIKWLARASDAIHQYWQRKNEHKRTTVQTS